MPETFWVLFFLLLQPASCCRAPAPHSMVRARCWVVLVEARRAVRGYAAQQERDDSPGSRRLGRRVLRTQPAARACYALHPWATVHPQRGARDNWRTRKFPDGKRCQGRGQSIAGRARSLPVTEGWPEADKGARSDVYSEERRWRCRGSGFSAAGPLTDLPGQRQVAVPMLCCLRLPALTPLSFQLRPLISETAEPGSRSRQGKVDSIAGASGEARELCRGILLDICSNSRH